MILSKFFWFRNAISCVYFIRKISITHTLGTHSNECTTKNVRSMFNIARNGGKQRFNRTIQEANYRKTFRLTLWKKKNVQARRKENIRLSLFDAGVNEPCYILVFSTTKNVFAMQTIEKKIKPEAKRPVINCFFSSAVQQQNRIDSMLEKIGKNTIVVPLKKMASQYFA